MPEPTFLELKARIDDLQKKADEARKSEIPEVIATIRGLMADYGIDISDLGPRKSGRSTKSGAAKYQDPATGRTWSGTGRQPRWFAKAIASGKKAEDLLVTAAVSPKPSAPSAAAKTSAARKRKAATPKKEKAAKPAPKAPARKARTTTRKRAAPAVPPSAESTSNPAQETAAVEATAPA